MAGGDTSLSPISPPCFEFRRSSTITIAFVDYFFVHAVPDSHDPSCCLTGGSQFCWLAVCGVRARLVREIWWPAITLQGRKPALLIGAVQGGEVLARQIHAHPKLDFRVVGFLDEDRIAIRIAVGRHSVSRQPRRSGRNLPDEHEAKDLLIISNTSAG